jgi:MSHA biogenesis protein MshJ
MSQASAYQRFQERFDALQPRERTLASLAVGVLLVLLVFLFWVEPAEKRAKAHRQQIESLSPQVEKSRALDQRLQAELAEDPEAARRALLDQLRDEAAGLDARLREDQAQVIPPARMPAVLRELLGRDGRLRVLAVESLPPEVLRWSPTPAAESSEGAATPAVPSGSRPEVPALYRHRVALRFEGDFASSLAYLKAVEALPYRLRLQSLEVDATRWPTLSLRLEVETLGLEEGWIGV